MGVVIGTVSAEPKLRGAATDELDREYQEKLLTCCRSIIQPVSGSGQIRGVFIFQGVRFAFRDNELGTECRLYKSTSSGWQRVTIPTFLPGGSFKFITHNFKGNSGSVKIYGVDGVNKGFEFDGSTLSFITTGMAEDIPTNLIGFKNHLFFSFAGGSVQHSSIGDPTTWTPITGAAEISIGQDISGFMDVPGESLAIFGRNNTSILSGPSVADWKLNSVDDEAGAIPNTIQGFKYPIYFDDRGLTNLQAVQTYGDFKGNSVSTKIEKLLRKRIPLITCSLRVKEKDQYRIFFSNGQAIFFTMKSGKNVGAMLVNYDKVVYTAFSGEDENGQEVLLFGSDDGYIYQADKGNSFDGETIDASIKPMFNHFGSPEHKKRFFKAVVEMEAKDDVDIKYLPEFNYGNTYLPSAGEGKFLDVVGGGASWDSLDSNWQDFYWDAPLIASAEAHLNGIGKNMSILIRSRSNYDEPYTMQGMIIHFSRRGINR